MIQTPPKFQTFALTQTITQTCSRSFANIKMDEQVAENMKEYIETSMKTIMAEKRKSMLLQDAVKRCEREIGILRKKITELEESALRKRVSLFKVRHEKGEGMSPIKDPCPTPINKGESYLIDPATTMCDIWSTWMNHEVKEQRVKQRREKQRDSYTKETVLEAFGSYAVLVDSPLYHAAHGFMKGSQQQYHSGKNESSRFVAPWMAELDNEPETRCMAKERKRLLAEMVLLMYEGEIGKDIELSVLKRKRFSTVHLARVSDMQSTFNPSALGSIAKCEGGKVKGEMGLLCSESTLRRTMDLVYDQAVQLGFSVFPEQGEGKVWCWGYDQHILEKAINMYVKVIYYDACCDGITKQDPWIVPITGDAARTSQRGTVVTVMGPKQSDRRLKTQDRTGKSLMCQASDMYTPAIAGYAKESELMNYFNALVAGFLKIEKQGFCLVNAQEYPVDIQVHVVADLSFLHKYVQRGGGSHSATCFCMMCSAFRNFRHEGYPGGCRKCRRSNTVYGKDGLQCCLHHEACTPDFLEWQSERYLELCQLVPALPLTVLPAWENVDELRNECMKRCVGDHAHELPGISRKSGKNYYTGQDLTDWITRYCRGGCTLSNDKKTGVMHCSIAIVNKCLRERNIACDGLNVEGRRLRMQGILQLEHEYTKMTLYMRDHRFSPTHPSALGIPMDRIILCLLHLPMRTHEKVLNLLFAAACEGRTIKKSTPILDAIVVILRRIGKLPDVWTYKMDEKNTSIVQKIKLAWDQSKLIFKEGNMKDLTHIVRLAIPHDNQANWVLFLAEYMKCINLLTVSRDYTETDLAQLESSCDKTFQLLVAHCGGDKAVTNYFHYLGAGHVTWMCHLRGNIWRYRNEGVEAFNKTLSKRTNMFNSAGNKGNIKTAGKVQPFEVLGKWMSRYVMWQLGLADNLFIAKGCILGESEICWDPDNACFIANDLIVSGDESEVDDLYSVSDDLSDSDCDDLDDYTPEDWSICAQEVELVEVESRNLRKRPYSV